MPITNDGSVVELYRRASGTAEAELIAARLDGPSTILDLGTGAGRISDALANIGHQVTGVDDSADMLAQVHYARTIQARIEDLRLSERFDVVILMSSLINAVPPGLREQLLATVAHHLKPTGKAIIQWRSPAWFKQWPQGEYYRADGPMRQTMTIVSNTGDVVDGEFVLEWDGQRLSQSFQAVLVSSDELKAMLKRVGMQLNTDEPDSSEWLEASLSA